MPPTIRAKTSQFSIRAEDTVGERADRLLEPENHARLSPLLQQLLVSRVAVMRECLLRGLAAYEAEIGLGPIDAPAPASKPAKAAKGRR